MVNPPWRSNTENVENVDSVMRVENLIRQQVRDDAWYRTRSCSRAQLLVHHKVSFVLPLPSRGHVYPAALKLRKGLGR